jgi:Enoyl-CoA hydratase/isomerase
MVDTVAARDLDAMLRAPVLREELFGLDPPLLVVALDSTPVAASLVAALPVVIVGVGVPDDPGAAATDVVATDDDGLARIDAVVRANPIAASSYALLLRGAPRPIEEGLVAESAVYSALQAGPEFASWRASREPRNEPSEDHPAVRVTREGDALHVTLTRPEVHNALNTRMRDELYDAFVLAAADPALTVVLDGEGPSFSAGGDLDEFGARADPASAHLVRLRRSVGRVIASIADRVEAHVHGACMGSGIELPAFAGRVVAHPDTRFGLPEIGLGLIPGAGGTVSVTRRVGRHRAALLALAGETIDAPTAHAWGLVDEVAT